MYWITLILVTIAAIFFIWRWYSRHATLPCPAWLAWMVEFDNPFAKAHKAKTIIETLPLQQNIAILDIGCGPGRVLIPLAQKIAPLNGHITGLDIQPHMILKAQKKAAALQVTNITFITGTPNQLADNYDIILMVCVLGEIPEPQQQPLLEKLTTLLRKNGIISITETMFDPHFQSHKTVATLMQKVGFVQTKFVGNKFAYTAQFKKSLPTKMY